MARFTGMAAIRKACVAALVVVALGLVLSSCLFQSRCLRECLARHEACVTRAPRPTALEACDAWLTRCQRGCR